mmetsp:Transcript_44000/g.94792  ORF Transcript_44000/g.94792 Transcript_44000/m.94792 type:complete len:545 (-) Transcript_44000:45-1679(-)
MAERRDSISMISDTAQRVFSEPIRIRKVRYADGTFSPEVPMHEDWLELFTDLLFVVMYQKIGALLAKAGPENGLTLVVVFIGFWNIFGGMYTMNRFVNVFACGGLVRLLLLALVPLGICHMTYYLDSDFSESGVKGYSIGFAVTRIGLGILFFKAWLHNRDMGYTTFVFSLTLLLNALVVAIVQHLSPTRLTATGAGLFVLVTEILARMIFLPCSPFWRSPPRFPGVNIGHVQARAGIALMVALGESIIQILTVEQRADASRWRNGMTMGGFTLALMIALVYFDAQPHNIEHHVIRRSWQGATLFMYLIPVLVFFVWLIGFGFEILILRCQSTGKGHNGHGDPHANPHSRRLSGHLAETWNLHCILVLFSSAIAIVHWCVTWIRWLHTGCDGFKTHRDRLRIVWQIILGGCHFCVCLVVESLWEEPWSKGMAEVWLHVALLVPMVLSTMRAKHTHHHEHGGGHHRNEDEDEEDEELPVSPGVSFAASRASRRSRGSRISSGNFTVDPVFGCTEHGEQRAEMRSFNPPATAEMASLGVHSAGACD